MADKRFRVGITRDALGADGKPVFDPAALAVLDLDPDVDWEFLPERVRDLTPDHAARYDALCVLGARVTRETVSRADRRLRIVARHGVGYDSVDVDACTENGVMLAIAPDGVRRPMAVAAITFVLSLAMRLFQKDRLTREGRWADRLQHMGTGLTGRTLGTVGAGNIGRELLSLAQPFRMRLLAADPVADPAKLAPLGAELVDLDTLLRDSDFVCINCPLSEATRGLIGAREIGLMKPTAFLVNTARGPIIDEAALTEALQAGRIAGAGLDVFEEEPTPADNPLLALDNVILAPHALGWTDQCFRKLAEAAFSQALAALHDRVPPHLVNRAVLEHPAVKTRLTA